MDTNEMAAILAKLDEQQKKLDAVYVSSEKLRNYFKWTLIITVVTVALPAMGLLFAIPYYLKLISASAPSAFGL